MAALIIKAFSGIRPRVPESLLQEREATIARNCDFAYGELRNTKAGFNLLSLSNEPLSLYTDDGLSFYSWPTYVNAVRSPIVNDQFQRMYFTGDGPMKVANRLSTSIDGGPPGAAYRVGVPRPSSAPTVTVDIPTVDLNEVNLKFTFHYESGGIKYQEQQITPNVLPGGKYQFTPPTRIAGVIEKASLDDFPKSGSDGSIYKATDTGTYYEWIAASYKEITSVNDYDTRDAFPANGPNASTAIQTGDVFRCIENGQSQYYVVTVTRSDVIFAFYSYKKLEKKAFIQQSDFPSVPVSAVYIDGTTSKLYLGIVGYYKATSEIKEGTPDNAYPVLRITGTLKSDDSTAFDTYSTNSTFYSNAGLYWTELQKDDGGDGYTATFNSGIQEQDKETRAYVYTYVNIYNEEGPPSNPTIVTTSLAVGARVKIKPMAWNDGYVPLKEVRIYRTPTGSTIADYFFVGSVSTSGTAELTFTDDVEAEQLNEPLASLNYYPPDAALIGLMSLPNGILCAWKDNELHFSEAYKPWAWPPAYVKPVEQPIVNGIVNGSGAVITTRARPYLVSGVSPDSMTTSKLNVDQAGVSPRSIAVVDGTVVYASNDGLVTVSGGSATLIPSQRFFTREVWRSRYKNGLHDMAFGVWDGRLVVFSASAAFTPFMLRFDEADGNLTDLPDLVAQCAFTSVLSDQMYYANANTVYQFNGGADLLAEWQSRELVLDRPTNFGAAQAVVEGDWQIEFWAYELNQDNTQSYSLRHTETLTAGVTNFRLPDGFESDRYRIKISGSGRFRELRIAQTFRELAKL